jgi:hypothetical protein
VTSGECRDNGRAARAASDLPRYLRDKGEASKPGLSDEKAARMMIALREGRTLNKFGVTAPRVEAYFRTHPEYAREARPLIAANIKAANLRKGAKRRAQTHCKYGHPLSGKNLYSAPGRRERKCWACIKERDRAPRPASEVQLQQVTAALNAGKTISEICWGKVDGEIVARPLLTFRKLRLHRQMNPDYEQFVQSVISSSNSKGQRRRFNPERFRITIIRSQTDDFHKVLAMLPERLANRDDVAATVFEELASGKLRRDQVKLRLSGYIAEQNEMFPIKYRKFGDRALVSLDELIFQDASMTRGDTITSGLWD